MPAPTGAIFHQHAEPVQDLVAQIDGGRLQLPNFQRDFVWESERTAKLLSSIMARYPVGVILAWTQSETNISRRHFSGAPATQPDQFRLVLDGQQRLTSLYRALRQKGDETYFVSLYTLIDDIGFTPREELDIDWDSVVLVNEPTLKERREETQPEYLEQNWQFKHWMFPVAQLESPGGFDEWLDGFVSELNPKYDKSLAKATLRTVRDQYVLQLKTYQFPTITLTQETTLLAVCRIFETINNTGVTLGPFELCTAKFFPDGENLRDRWEAAREQYTHLDEFGIDPYAVLQALALRSVGSAQRSDVLKKLKAHHVTANWDSVIYGFKHAVELLREECGVKTKEWLPYAMVLVPLAAVWDKVDAAPGAKKAAARAKLKRWFWCTVFTGNYDQGANSQAQADFAALTRWLDAEGEPPDTEMPEAVTLLPISADAILRATVKKKALYRGMMALLMRQGAKDFHEAEPITPNRIASKRIDSHHVFPKKWLEDAGLQGSELILNRTLINAATNRRIGKKAPSAYIQDIKDVVADGDLTAVLESHLVPVDYLEGDDYEGFISQRLNLVVGALSEVIAPTTVHPLPDLQDVETAAATTSDI